MRLPQTLWDYTYMLPFIGSGRLGKGAGFLLFLLYLLYTAAVGKGSWACFPPFNAMNHRPLLSAPPPAASVR
jgi:hypothetical protein